MEDGAFVGLMIVVVRYSWGKVVVRIQVLLVVGFSAFSAAIYRSINQSVSQFFRFIF